MSMATAALLIARRRIGPAFACRLRVGWLGRGDVGVAARRRRRGLADFLEQGFDALLAGDRLVVLEGQLRRAAEADARGDALAQERFGALEGLGGGAPRGLVAERRVIGPRHLQIG